jgi:hypothetical protein
MRVWNFEETFMCVGCRTILVIPDTSGCSISMLCHSQSHYGVDHNDSIMEEVVSDVESQNQSGRVYQTQREAQEES